MTSSLTPGSAGEPLPQGEQVLRLLKHPTTDGVVSPTDFDLSTDDKASSLKSVSVYAVQLTTGIQAIALMQDPTKCRNWCTLEVDAIRVLRPDPDNVHVANLDVVWDPKMMEEAEHMIPDKRPGASGHSGITGLARPPMMDKSLYKSLRQRLARIASPHSVDQIF